MAKYKIAWMPGDGVGKEVMDATRIVLDAMKFDAEYVPADIGWDFWRQEGNPLPDRTIKILRETDCALFGAITSKPRDEANEELDPSLRGKGLSYFSPIVKLRQLFDLHTNLRPCKAYPGNPSTIATTSTWSSSARTPRAATAGSSGSPCPRRSPPRWPTRRSDIRTA
ncbi:MAG: isocitrate/isopropylmalate family dehydrogenase [Phycisphaerales bacterium]